MKRSALLGVLMLVGVWVATRVHRARQLRAVDNTAPDAFGSAVVRAEPGSSGDGESP